MICLSGGSHPLGDLRKFEVTAIVYFYLFLFVENRIFLYSQACPNCLTLLAGGSYVNLVLHTELTRRPQLYFKNNMYWADIYHNCSCFKYVWGTCYWVVLRQEKITLITVFTICIPKFYLVVLLILMLFNMRPARWGRWEYKNFI